jgi:hypothetical protein
LLGDVENAGTFFAHSLVFWEGDGVRDADDNASKRGDVIGFSFGAIAAGFISGDSKREGGDLAVLHHNT